LLLAKFVRHVSPHFSQAQQDAIMKASENLADLENMDVDLYVDLYIKS
jgi:hypothetical protein